MRRDFKYGLIIGSAFSVVFLVFYTAATALGSPEESSPSGAAESVNQDNRQVEDSSVIRLRNGDKGYMPEGGEDFVERVRRRSIERSQRESENTSEQSVAEEVAADNSAESETEKEPVKKEPQKYTVASGDTLSGISKRFYGTTSDWQKILEANRDKLKNPAGLKPGMELTIPE